MKKYTSALTAKLTPDNWLEKLNPNLLSLDDVVDLLGDFREMEKFSKQVAGYLKETVRGKLPRDTNEYTGKTFGLTLALRVRKGALNEELIQEEMGDEWLEAHRKAPIEYEEMRVFRVEEGEE